MKNLKEVEQYVQAIMADVMGDTKTAIEHIASAPEKVLDSNEKLVKARHVLVNIIAEVDNIIVKFDQASDTMDLELA